MISWGNPARPYWFLKEPDPEQTRSQNLRKGLDPPHTLHIGKKVAVKGS